MHLQKYLWNGYHRKLVSQNCLYVQPQNCLYVQPQNCCFGTHTYLLFHKISRRQGVLQEYGFVTGPVKQCVVESGLFAKLFYRWATVLLEWPHKYPK
jgi:hypothetical protein